MGHAADLDSRLRQHFAPLSLEIIDESHRHAGHQESFDGTGETHLRVRIVAEAFDGMSRVERHRAINSIAADSLEKGLHALAIDARTPQEAAAAPRSRN